VSEFAEILQVTEVALKGAIDPRAAFRRFECSVQAFEQALGGLVPPVGAYRASAGRAAPPHSRFASYAAGVATAAGAPARNGARATYA
jgi:hypothetical protein